MFTPPPITPMVALSSGTTATARMRMSSSFFSCAKIAVAPQSRVQAKVSFKYILNLRIRIWFKNSFDVA